jgi:hypothetical protein
MTNGHVASEVNSLIITINVGKPNWHKEFSKSRYGTAKNEFQKFQFRTNVFLTNYEELNGN